MAEAIVRVQLLLVAPVALVLIGIAAERGGVWLALLPPASLILVGHARLGSEGSRSLRRSVCIEPSRC